MKMSMKDTIYALSTPLGNGVAVIRISGSEAINVLRGCFSRVGEYVSHVMYYGFVMLNGCEVDEAMAVYFKAPRSYTGEDSAELHCHGSRAAMARVFEAISASGARQAQPGEFSRRAFLNGRMDLSQAEAVMDLIHADASRAAASALEQIKGAMGEQVTRLQDLLTDAIARVEAALDYPEEDWEGEIAQEIRPILGEVLDKTDALIQSGAQGAIVREGLKVALIGRPNVGKSTLLNALLGMKKAIVTDIPGTTRDLIEGAIEIDGIALRIIDTAGLRQSGDTVEKIGVQLAKETIANADLVLTIFDGAQAFNDEDIEVLRSTENKPRIVVISKSDLPQTLDVLKLEGFANQGAISISAHNDEGMNELKSAISAHFDSLAPNSPAPLMVTNSRHIEALREAHEAVIDALNTIENSDMDCLTIDMRRAWHALGLITGLSSDESIVDRIFEKFCLGK